MFGVLPENWVEQRFGFDPDAGSGLLGYILTFILVAMGVGLAVLAFWPHPSITSAAGADSALPLR